jgi:two-component system sensor histidine kinase KdpD
LFGGRRPPLGLGFVLAALAVAIATAVIYPLKSLAPAVSLSVVYLPAVLLVSVYSGLAFGLATSLASAAAFNFFYIDPIHRFTISDARNWVVLTAFVVVAVVVSTIAELARTRAIEAERRREEADLAAGLARELLAGAQTSEVLGSTARRLAEALTLPSAAIELGAAGSDTARAESP